MTYFATYGMHIDCLTENFAFSTFQYYANNLNEFHVGLAAILVRVRDLLDNKNVRYWTHWKSGLD